MKATHQPPTDPQLTPADVLRMAALYLRRHGWLQGSYYSTDADSPTPSACLVGAVGITCAGRRLEYPGQLDRTDEATYRQALAVVVDYLDSYQPICAVDEDGFFLQEHISPYSWNDDPGRTAEDVITALEAAADEWDRLHTKGGENK